LLIGTIARQITVLKNRFHTFFEMKMKSRIRLQQAAVLGVLIFDGKHQHHHFCHGRLGGDANFNSFPSSLSVENNENPVNNLSHIFAPLECNSELSIRECTNFVSSVLPRNRNDTFVIPCGECFVWDVDTIALPGGIDIQGKLVIRRETKLETPFIIVQGILEMKALGAITGDPKIHIQLVDLLPSSSPMASTSMNHHPPTFQALAPNHIICEKTPSLCQINVPGVIVAGGQVDWDGLPSPSSSSLLMTTWTTRLLDVVPSATAQVPADSSPPETVPLVEHQPSFWNDCPPHGIYQHFNLHDQSLDQWWNIVRGSLGTSIDIIGHSIRVSDRKHSRQGIELQLSNQIQHHCLDDATTYLVTMRLSVESSSTAIIPNNKGTAKTATPCESNGRNCLKIDGVFQSGSLGNIQSDRKWTERQVYNYALRDSFLITTDISFSKQELSTDNLYHALSIHGIPPEYDLFISEFTLRQAPTIPKQCDNLVPMNGNAEAMGFLPYPFKTNNPNVLLEVRQDLFNHYFSVLGRSNALHGLSFSPDILDENWDDIGLTWTLDSACLWPRRQFQIHVDVRIGSDSGARFPLEMEFAIRSRRPQNMDDTFVTMLYCKIETSRQWTSCEGVFEISKELISDSTLQYDVVIETVGTFTIDYDIDNISISSLDQPLDLIVSQEAIKDYWTTGSQIAITIPEAEYDNQDMYRITGMSDFDGLRTRITLDPMLIQVPKTLQDSGPYAAEVSLLSRNIVVEGSDSQGGQLLILSDTDRTQTIHGTRLVKMNEEANTEIKKLAFTEQMSLMGAIFNEKALGPTETSTIPVSDPNSGKNRSQKMAGVEETTNALSPATVFNLVDDGRFQSL
jgi:hypothetical protein